MLIRESLKKLRNASEYELTLELIKYMLILDILYRNCFLFKSTSHERIDHSEQFYMAQSVLKH